MLFRSRLRFKIGQKKSTHDGPNKGNGDFKQKSCLQYAPVELSFAHWADLWNSFAFLFVGGQDVDKTNALYQAAKK